MLANSVVCMCRVFLFVSRVSFVGCVVLVLLLVGVICCGYLFVLALV